MNRQLHRFWEIYGQGLNRQEIEQLITRDAQAAFSFYQRDQILQPRQPGCSRTTWIARTLKTMFISFFMKLNPARRLFYVIAIGLFLWGLWDSHAARLVMSFVLMNILLALELADKLLTKDELDIARAIQLGLLPEHAPDLGGISIACCYETAKEVGGDYYDFLALNGKLVVIIGDASGKGMPAALYAVKLQGLFELLAKTAESPRDMLTRMNEVMASRIDKKYFITAVLTVIDLKQESFTLARAGHNQPLYYDAAVGKARFLNPPGL